MPRTSAEDDRNAGEARQPDGDLGDQGYGFHGCLLSRRLAAGISADPTRSQG
jgi:hypothetical protein